MSIYNSLDSRIESYLTNISICKDTLQQYLSLINTYIENPPKENFEKHHILPKSLFPEFSNLNINKWNEVKLPIWEHLEAHYYLSICTSDPKMKFAFNKMIDNNINFLNEKYKIQYENNRKQTKDFIPAKDKDGNIYYISKNDPRLISGELIHVNKGRK